MGKIKEHTAYAFLRKLPTFDPSWSSKVKEKWFECFRELKETFKGIGRQ